MMTGGLATLAALLLPGEFAAAQEPASEPAKQGGTVAVATLGASTRAPSKQEVEQLGLKVDVRARGQVVTEVDKGAAVARAGIEPGDVLVKLGAVDLYSQDDIADCLRVRKPGEKLEAVVLRRKTAKEETVAVSLGARETKAPEEPRLEWQFASLGQLPDALAKAKKEGRPVLVGLSGAET